MQNIRAALRELGLIDSRGHLWEADHVTECIRGGWGKGIDNFRTLCIPCHKEETARLARERADERRLKKQGVLDFGVTP